MLFEFLTGNFIYSAAKDLVGSLVRWFRPMRPEQKIKLRQKWKAQFEDHIIDRFAKKLRSDVIILDVKRLDQYPDVKEKEVGISAWFRCSLVGTYHRGILVALGLKQIVEFKEGEYRLLDFENDDQQAKNRSIKVFLIGKIPFEHIEDVDFDGDEYYRFPHIYCHYKVQGMPYERVAFFTEKKLFDNALPYYTEVVELRAVQENSEGLV